MPPLTFRMVIDFSVAFPEPVTQPLGPEEYEVKSRELFAEIEGKIEDLGFRATPRDIFTYPDVDGDIQLDFDGKPRFQGPESIPPPLEHDHWFVQHPPMKGFDLGGLPDYNVFYKVCLWTPWLLNSNESIESVRKVFEMLSNDYDIWFKMYKHNNPRTMEVHVAPASHRFTLRHVRNLMAFLWSFELKLDGLHPERSSDDRRTDWTHRQSLRDNCELSWRQNKAQTAEQELEKILACKSIEEVIHLTTHPDTWGSLVYDINQLENSFPSLYDADPAVKFEQERPTLDGERVENWLKVCFGIMEFTANSDRKLNIPDFIRSHLGDDQYTVFDLLRDIGIPEQADYYRQVVDERNNTEIDWVDECAKSFSALKVKEGTDVRDWTKY